MRFTPQDFYIAFSIVGGWPRKGKFVPVCFEDMVEGETYELGPFPSEQSMNSLYPKQQWLVKVNLDSDFEEKVSFRSLRWQNAQFIYIQLFKHEINNCPCPDECRSNAAVVSPLRTASYAP
jgi:hypothetical protein